MPEQNAPIERPMLTRMSRQVADAIREIETILRTIETNGPGVGRISLVITELDKSKTTYRRAFPQTLRSTPARVAK